MRLERRPWGPALVRRRLEALGVDPDFEVGQPDYPEVGSEDQNLPIRSLKGLDVRCGGPVLETGSGSKTGITLAQPTGPLYVGT